MPPYIFIVPFIVSPLGALNVIEEMAAVPSYCPVAIKVATAEGNAQAMLTSAKAEAESNRMKQVTLTPLLLQLEYINKWDGKLPVYGTVPQMFKNIQ